MKNVALVALAEGDHRYLYFVYAPTEHARHSASILRSFSCNVASSTRQASADYDATSYEALDADLNVQEEVRNVARAVANTVRGLRAETLVVPDAKLKRPLPK